MSINKKPPLSANQQTLLQQAVALHQSGKLPEATALYQNLLKLQPTNTTALSNLGTIALMQGKLEEGIKILTASLKIDGNQPATLNNMGIAHFSLKQYADALACHDRAIDLNAAYADAWCNRGIALLELHRLTEALDSFNRAIAINPRHAHAYHNRGNAFKNLNRLDEAIASYDHALALDPNQAEVFCNRGLALIAAERYEEALASFERAIAINPNLAHAYANRAGVLQTLHRQTEALDSCNRAIALNPQLATAYANRGAIFMEWRRLDEALADYDQAIAHNPDFAEAYWNKALLKILSGDYVEGWALYEWGWRSAERQTPCHPSGSLWLGEQALAGKTLMIYPEQGFGDYIQFSRYAALAEQQGARVILVVHAPLLNLISSLKGGFSLIDSALPLPDADYHCPVMSLPLAFKTTLQTVPAEIPYLYADPVKQLVWRQRLGEKSKPRVGLVVSGSGCHKNDHNRSIALQEFAPLLELPFEFHCLQQEIRADDARFIAETGGIRTHQEQLADFSDTAALLAEMDLIISVDTSLAHLAGAMAKAVWILLPYAPDFRWRLDSADSPWYPTATLFRQAAANDWHSVIQQLETRLAAAYGPDAS
jgi:tetratricopeptide (TPR) repeat protein